MLNFGNELEPLFVFAGLSFLTVIGPLLKWYVEGMTRPNYKVPKYFFVELIPFAIAIAMSFFVPEDWLETNNKLVIAVFGTFLISVYLHLAIYIWLASRIVFKLKKHHKNALQTKAQKSVLDWLQLLIFSFVIIWVSYFLNIIEDAVPYIVGPIIYSIVVYYSSIKAYQLKILDINGAIFNENKDASLYNKIYHLVIYEKRYLEPQISLVSLSKLLNQSPQKTSEIINQYANQNFNDFINYHRIQEAKKMLIADKSRNNKIAAIAFDTGFSSLSSFNSAFKKFEKKTPSSYRKEFSV